jgi:type II secretory ATPase GspE/PulE/Tfp pilus assembly ATPase PilB-like protein
VLSAFSPWATPFAVNKVEIKLLITAARADKTLFAAPPFFISRKFRPSTMISDIKDLPQAQYLSFESVDLPHQFQEHFALMLTLEGQLLLLTQSQAHRTHLQFDLRRRLMALEQTDRWAYSGIHELEVSEDILRSVHAYRAPTVQEESTSVETAAWALIDQAVGAKASDIHIETRGPYAQVFFRVHGERLEQANISSKRATEMCNVLYGVHADAHNKGVTWDEMQLKEAGIEHHTSSGQHVQLRLSSAPIHPAGNFHVVIRLLVMSKWTAQPLKSMGYDPLHLDLIDEMLLGSQGAVFLVGPTNSGKSTALQAFIEALYQHRGRSIKVITVEKPVEYWIESACQMGVSPFKRDWVDESSGSIYSKYVAATLRQDPDVVMMGEVNDHDSAENMKHLVLSGRKALSTLHAYEAMALFARLRELGVPPSVLYMRHFISGVIFQRLVPLLCQSCACAFQDAHQRGLVAGKTYERVKKLGVGALKHVKIRGLGCAECEHTGIVGRTVCAEVLVPDEEFLFHLREGRYEQAKRHWMSQSALSLKAWGVKGLGGGILAHAVLKMHAGLIDPMDIERWIGPLHVEKTGP